jgi:hypothetical protein
MHHPPDLSLASSYIPACLCLFKCTIAFVLFIFSPVRGWIGLFSVLLTDRILWNQAATSTILDVNAVCVALVGGLVVMHTRAEGLRTLAHFGVAAAWALLSCLQLLNATRLHRAYEVLFAAFAVSTLSCMHQAPERTELLALRSFVFVVANVTLPYLGVVLQHSDIDTYVNACRTLLILLGEPEVASAWAATYVLCLGYQLRTTGAGGSNCMALRRTHAATKYHPSSYYDDEQPGGMLSITDTGCCVVDSPRFKSVNGGSLGSGASAVSVSTAPQPSSLSASATSSSEEAALLREALASRKGFRDA